MKEHHLSVVSLEEYEPNREFVGRNFNAGEVIQLVLKSARPPHRWLPFRYVQMVMMHELAHCRQMNHSRAFWAVRNAYAAEMTALWSKGYTGEGIWGRGAALGTGAWERDTVAEGEPLPEHLCGGTYRSRGRRGRKRKPKLSWKEQKERRIAKKFGVNGTALGADESEKVKLEGGKKVTGKPRVAGSARGRDLRAAAALARFDKQKIEDVAEELPLKDEDETESGSDYEELAEGDDAVDLDGSKMKDNDGRALVKVCEDEDANDPAARNELDELRSVFSQKPVVKTEAGSGHPAADERRSRIKGEPESSQSLRTIPAAPTAQPLRLHDIPHIRDAIPPRSKPTPKPSRPKPASPTSSSSSSNPRPAITIHRLPASTSTTRPAAKAEPPKPTTSSSSSNPQPAITIQRLPPSTAVKAEPPPPPPPPATGTTACALCSLDNEPAALRCAACANVLRPERVQGAWRCASAACEGTGYVNAGDCGVCGLCGSRKP